MTCKIILLTLGLVGLANCQRWRTIEVGVGDHCALGAAPVGPGGAFQVVEHGVTKNCVPGTSCRNGACNCDNLPDGTVTGISVDAQGNRSCKRVAGQRCSADNQCFDQVKCIQGKCTCDNSLKDFYCVNEKNDVYILAGK